MVAHSKHIKVLDHRELRVDPASGWLHARVWVDGRRVMRALNIKASKVELTAAGARIPDADAKLALSALRKVLVDLAREERKSVEPKTMSELFPLFFDFKEKAGTKAGTLKKYKSTWDRVVKGTFGPMLVKDINIGHLEDYEADFHRQFPKRRRVTEPINLVTNILNYGFRRGMRKEPAPKLKLSKKSLRKEKPRARYILSAEEEKKWLKEAANIEAVNYNFELLCQLRLKTGIRPWESNRLKKDRVHVKENRIVLLGVDDLGFEDAKNGKPRVIPLPSKNKEFDRLRDLLYARVKERDGNDFVFPGLTEGSHLSPQGEKKHWETCVLKTGLDITPYDLRHTCAVNMARAGMHPVMAAKILGHDPKIYLAVYCNPKTDDLEKEFEKYGQHVVDVDVQGVGDE